MTRKLPSRVLTPPSPVEADKTTDSPQSEYVWWCVPDEEYLNHPAWPRKKALKFRKAVLTRRGAERPHPDACGPFELNKVCVNHYWATDEVFGKMLERNAENALKELEDHTFERKRSVIEVRWKDLRDVNASRALDIDAGHELLRLSSSVEWCVDHMKSISDRIGYVVFFMMKKWDWRQETC